MNSVDLIDKPITTKDYHIYDINDLPKLFLGYRVKNKLDEKRLSIKSIYKPKLVSHFTSDKLEPMFFYGIELFAKNKFTDLFEILNKEMGTYINNNDEFLNVYKKLLNTYNLSCHNCYGYLADGIYPIDIEHLQDLSRKDFTDIINSGFKDLIKKNQNPWFMNLYNFNLYIFGECTGYKSDFIVNTQVNNF